MLNSSKRKQALSGWLKTKDPQEFADPLKLQKFLFFYEIISKVEEKDYELTKLKGYAAGPVFSDIYGDYRYNKDLFNQTIVSALKENNNVVNEDIATFCLFLIQTQTREELSEITHQLDIWKSKQDMIEWGEWQTSLHESDLSVSDAEFIKRLRGIYPKAYTDTKKVVKMNQNRFVFSAEDYHRLTPTHYDTMKKLAEFEELFNPVYTEIDVDGGLLVYD